MKTRLILGAVMLVCFGWTGPVFSAPVPAAKHTPFMTVLLRDWDKWDTNKDGQLEIPEIDRAVADISVTGDDAAVAGSLKLMSRSKKYVVPAFTKEYFEQYDHDALNHLIKTTGAAAELATSDTTAAAGPTTAPSNRPINWDLYYTAAKHRIAKGADAAWPMSYSLDHVQQGPLGDCYLLATIGAMIVHHPSDVDALVQPVDGGYRVTIPNTKPFIVPALTQSQLALSSTTVGEGDWLAVIEQGVGRYNEIAKGSSDDEGTDTIANGGQITDTMRILTGHQYKRIHMRATVAQRQNDAATIIPTLRAELIAAIHDQRLITASVHLPTPTPATTTHPALTVDMLPKIPPNITTRHAYAIVNFDADKDMLEIWNPHGQTFTPRSEDGLQNGYTTKHGVFHIPLSEAYAFYTSFVFELNAPAAVQTPRH